MNTIYQVVQLFFTALFLYVIVRGLITTFHDAEDFVNRRNRW